MYEMPYVFIDEDIREVILQQLRWDYYMLKFECIHGTLCCSEDLRWNQEYFAIKGFCQGANFIAGKLRAKCE